jgi:hypothetical protein
MNKIAVSILALGAALATPAFANEATHNGLPVATPSVEAIRTGDVQTGFSATTQSAFVTRSGVDRSADAARGAQSGS